MNKIQRSLNAFKPRAAGVLLLLLGAPWAASTAWANAAFGSNTDIAGNVINVPTYYANSPQGVRPAFDPVTHQLSAINPATGKPFLTVDTGTPIRKFVDPLGGVYNGLENLPGMTDLQSGIPVAIPEKWKNPLTGVQTTDDYYEIAVVEFTQRLHTDLAKATRLRAYVQIATPSIRANGTKDITGLIGSENIPATYPNGDPIKDSNGNPVYFVHKPHYLGPAILAAKGNPVRIKFINYLPYTDVNGVSVGSVNGMGGESFVPVDETIAGGGPVLKGDGTPQLDQNGHPIKMAQNRVAIHWHGGDSPWISDGTPHQWFAPAGDISYTIGDALHPVKDANHPNGVGMGKGDSTADVPDMPPPGDGAYTLYFPNNLSGRLMMYHDHVSGLTKVNVYMGEAAGYVVYDPTELTLVANAIGTTLTKTLGDTGYTGPFAALPIGLLDAVGIPLVIQDKTFVPKNIGPNAFASDGTTPASQDAKWDLNHWGNEGDFFFPHVYETNQDPNSADGTNPVGRWDWGPWFWPVFPAQFSLPSGSYGDATATPEAFMDTPVVNGQAYPTMTVDPKTYRFRILSVANDRSQNLGLYQAVDANGLVCDAKAAATVNTQPIPPGITATSTPLKATPMDGGAPLAACTEVKMVPAKPTAGFPANWPTDGRVGGVPDPATAGPDIVQIGSEGGLLPAPAVWKSQPVSYDQNVRNITVFNILNHDLLLMGGERADVLIDFSKYAGKTLILYNDAPAPMPGLDPRIDYYTGMGDFTGAGGAYDVLPGYGPNTRTVMQIVVNNIAPGHSLDVAALANALPAAYAATQPAPIIPEKVYNAPFGTNSVNNYAAIGTGSGALDSGLFSYTETVNGVTTTKKLPVINKAIQELFDPIYGRMNATLAVELPFSTATIATTIPLAYVDTPVERLDAIKDGETQIWKVTHNGVDAHPVHFHLVNVQVINRVAWDGTIRPPEANEVGWKETLRMNPLEDVYVAVKASHPVVPFGLPGSKRLLDPSQVVGGGLGFTNIDPTTGGAPLTQTYLVNGVMMPVSLALGNPLGAPPLTYSNQVTDFDNEYVWHCHILGHEEQDFMRPFIFHPTPIVPDAPANVTVAGTTVTWIDTTPYGGQDAQGVPTAGTNAAHPEPTSSMKNEIGFRVYSGAALVATLPANVTSWTDASVSNANVYSVVAYNAAGNSIAGTSSTTTTAGGLVGGGGVTPPVSTVPAPALDGPAGPTGLGVKATGLNSAILSWTHIPGATGYLVTDSNSATVTVTVPVCDPITGVCTATVTGLAAGNNTFQVSAMLLSGNTMAATIGLYNGKAHAPVALTGSSAAAINGLPRSSISLTWANDPKNINNVTGLTLTWVEEGKTSPKGTAIFAPGSTGTTVVGLTRDLKYVFTVVANSLSGSSTASTITITAR